MLGAHVIGFCEKGSVNNLSHVVPLADRMDVNDFKFSRSPYAIDSAASSVSSRVQRSSPERHSPERAEAVPTPIPEGPGEAQHAGSPPQTGTLPQSEGHVAGAAVNEFGTNVDVLGSWKPSPIDFSRAEINPNWEDVETEIVWDNQQRSPPQPANAEEEEGFQETHCSPPGASRCASHPDVEIVSSAPSQLVVPLVELSSDDEIEKPHESDDDDEEESGPFEQTETKPLKLPSGVVIKVEKDHWRLEEEGRARRIARRSAREVKEKEMTDAVAASQAEVADMRKRQVETDRKQQALERQMAELMARMNPEAISSEASPSAVPAIVTPPSISPLCIAVAPHAAQQTESAAADRRGDDRREAAIGIDVDIVASTQEPPASMTSGVAGPRRGDDTLQSRDLHHQSPASEEEPLDYREGEQLSAAGAEEGPPQEGQSATATDEVVILETKDLKVYFQRF